MLFMSLCVVEMLENGITCSHDKKILKLLKNQYGTLQVSSTTLCSRIIGKLGLKVFHDMHGWKEPIFQKPASPLVRLRCIFQ